MNIKHLEQYRRAERDRATMGAILEAYRKKLASERRARREAMIRNLPRIVALAVIMGVALAWEWFVIGGGW